MRNLPTDLLRTYVTVAELRSFTAAGNRLGRSQPAVSLQIKRLEDHVGSALLRRTTGRRIVLTEAGRTLLEFARQMLALNDEVVARLTRPRISGVVRLGIPNEFASSFLPEALGKFSVSHPDVALNVGCDLSTNLRQRLGAGEFDLILALQDQSPREEHAAGWLEPLTWVASPQGIRNTGGPLPLIVAPEGCVYRNRLINTLDGLRRDWRVVYTSQSFGGIRAGVTAGLGVTVLAQRTVPPELRMLAPDDHWPALGHVHARLHYDRSAASEAVLRLVDYMIASARHGQAPVTGYRSRRRISRDSSAVV